MVIEPTVYSVTIAAIAFISLSLNAIARSFNTPRPEPKESIPLILPESRRPIGLLTAGPHLLPASVLVAPETSPIANEVAIASQHAESAPTATIVGLLTDNGDSVPARPPILLPPAAPAPAPAPDDMSDTPVYQNVVMRDHTPSAISPASQEIPSPWDDESDRYWHQNSAIIYPNVTTISPASQEIPSPWDD